MHMHKIETFQGSEWVAPKGHPSYVKQHLKNGTDRLFGHIPNGDPLVFQQLVLSLSEPYTLFYILHTPRGEAAAGRYQSESISAQQLSQFISAHIEFLAGDARFDLWGRSAHDESTVVWDRHNLLYLYGQLSKFDAPLKASGFIQQAPEPIGEHKHFYREELDPLASSFLVSLSWHHSPLKPEDEQ